MRAFIAVAVVCLTQHWQQDMSHAQADALDHMLVVQLFLITLRLQCIFFGRVRNIVVSRTAKVSNSFPCTFSVLGEKFPIVACPTLYWWHKFPGRLYSTVPLYTLSVACCRYFEFSINKFSFYFRGKNLLPALAKAVSDRCMQTFHNVQLHIPLTGHLDAPLR